MSKAIAMAWRPRRLVVLGLALLAMAASGYFAWKTWRPGGAKLPPEIQEQVYWQPVTIGAFSLERHGSAPLSPEALRGHWSFLFFGYTHCPDICPATLAVLGQAFRLIDQHPGKGGATQGILISVDPRRDTPAALAEYAAFFHQRFQGATGSAEQLAALSGQLGVTHAIQAGSAGASAENYQVAHSATIFLIDPRGRLFARFPPPQEASEIAKAFARIRVYYEERESKRWAGF